MKLSSSDRKSLIKLAGTHPKGSAERRAILAGLKRTRTAGDDAKVVADEFLAALQKHNTRNRLLRFTRVELSRGKKVKIEAFRPWLPSSITGPFHPYDLVGPDDEQLWVDNNAWSKKIDLVWQRFQSMHPQFRFRLVRDR